MYGALIEAGGAIAGGLLSKPKTQNANKAIKFETDRLRRLQSKFGISPLAALGTSMPMLSTQVGHDYGLTAAAGAIGQGMREKAASSEAAKERELQRELEAAGQAQAVKESEARIYKDRSIGDYHNWLRTDAARQGKVTPVTPTPSAQPGAFGGEVLVKPDEVVSARTNAPHVTAGTHAGLREHVVTASGGKLLFPYSEEGLHENMESMWNPFYFIPVINASVKAYGAKAVARTLSEMYLPQSLLQSLPAAVKAEIRIPRKVDTSKPLSSGERKSLDMLNRGGPIW